MEQQKYTELIKKFLYNYDFAELNAYLISDENMQGKGIEAEIQYIVSVHTNTMKPNFDNFEAERDNIIKIPIVFQLEAEVELSVPNYFIVQCLEHKINFTEQKNYLQIKHSALLDINATIVINICYADIDSMEIQGVKFNKDCELLKRLNV